MSGEGRILSTQWSYYAFLFTTIVYTITWIISCWGAAGRADKLAHYSNWTNYTNSSFQHKNYAQVAGVLSAGYHTIHLMKTVDVQNAIQNPAMLYVSALETMAGASGIEVLPMLYTQPCHVSADRVLQIFLTFACVGAVFVAVFLILANILVWTKALESSSYVNSWSVFFSVMFLFMFTFTAIITGLLSMELFYNVEGMTIRTCLRDETSIYAQAMAIFILLMVHIIIWIVLIINSMVGAYLFPLSSHEVSSVESSAAYPYTYHPHAGMNS